MQKKHTKLLREVRSYLFIAAAAFLAALLIGRIFIINAQIPSGSMEDTIKEGDRLLGGRLSYLFTDPKRRDIVVFKSPEDGQKKMIKRIIGLPGDSVYIGKGTLYINGEKTEEDFIKEPMEGDFGPYTVPQGKYFVMGDNRNNSKDSRYWSNSFVDENDILAKAWFVYAPDFSVL